VWKIQDFSATHILREINLNLGHFEAPKSAILAIVAALNVLVFGIFFDMFKCEIPKNQNSKASKVVKMAVFELLKSAKIDFT